MKLTQTELREKLKAMAQDELSQASRNDDGAVAEALAYYDGALPASPLSLADPGDDDEVAAATTLSADVSTDVADMINADLAMLVPMISTDAVVTFEPNGVEDIPQSRMESDAVNAKIMEDCSGFIEIQEAVKDALMFSPGCLKVEVRAVEDVTMYPIPEDMPNEQIAALLEVRSPNETREETNGAIKVVTRTREFRCNAVPPENLRFKSGYLGPLQECPFFAERIEYTRSELRLLGVPASRLAEVPNQGRTDGTTVSARTGTYAAADEGSLDAASETIECFESYILLDADGDGVSERYKVLTAGEGEFLLLYENVQLIPYGLGSPFLASHTITGESLYQHIRPTQDTKTTLLRQYINNIKSVNNGKFIYDPSNVTEDDVLTPRSGGGIRARNPANSVIPLMIPSVGGEILQGLEYQDKMRTERGGAALDLMGANSQLASETAFGMERQYASRELLVSMFAKNLAETLIRQTWLLMHRVPPALLGWADDGEAIGRMGGDRSAPMASPNPAQREHGTDARSSCGPFPSPCGTRSIADGGHRPGRIGTARRLPNDLQHANRLFAAHGRAKPGAVSHRSELASRPGGGRTDAANASGRGGGRARQPRASQGPRGAEGEGRETEMGGRERLQVLPSGPRRRGEGDGDRSEN